MDKLARIEFEKLSNQKFNVPENIRNLYAYLRTNGLTPEEAVKQLETMDEHKLD